MQKILDDNGPHGGTMLPGDNYERRALEDVLKTHPPQADLTKAGYLRNETLGPGSAGPGEGRVWGYLRMSADDRIAYLKRLMPVPHPSGSRAPGYVADGPASSHDAVNIPPLFSPDGKLISGGDNPYDIVIGADSNLRGFTHYAGFSLRINWGPFSDYWNDGKELRLNYDKYYFMTKFFKDVVGLEFLMDTTLLDIYAKLPKEKA